MLVLVGVLVAVAVGVKVGVDPFDQTRKPKSQSPRVDIETQLEPLLAEDSPKEFVPS